MLDEHLRGVAAARMERLKHEVLRAARAQGPFTWPGPLIAPEGDGSSFGTGRQTPPFEACGAKRRREGANVSPEKPHERPEVAALELLPNKQGKFIFDDAVVKQPDEQLEEDAYDLLSVVVNQLFEGDGAEDTASVETEATWPDCSDEL